MEYSWGLNVLTGMLGLGRLFSAKAVHPLADRPALDQILSDLPADNAFQSIDELTLWLESVAQADLDGGLRYQIATALDDAAQSHLARLSRIYLLSSRLSRSEANRLWQMHSQFWKQLALCYEGCYVPLGGEVPDLPTSRVAAWSVRLIVALSSIIKWSQFRYGPFDQDIWFRMGRALRGAISAGADARRVNLKGSRSGLSATEVYRNAALFHAASVGGLLPDEIALAEKLIAYFGAEFVFSARAEVDSVYWVDLASAQAPMRLACMPKEAIGSQRFIKPASNAKGMLDVL